MLFDCYQFAYARSERGGGAIEEQCFRVCAFEQALQAVSALIGSKKKGFTVVNPF